MIIHNVRYIEHYSSIRNIAMATKSTKNVSADPPRVGDRLAHLRQTKGLSLDELSRQAGVSKSMLSQIERAQANPTVAVVWRLANALGVDIGSLLGDQPRLAVPAISIVHAHGTPSLRSPDGLCDLHILGPIELAGNFEWYTLSIQAGGVLESEAHEHGTREHLTVMTGSLEVSTGGEQQRIKQGETARYAVDRKHAIRNPTKSTATALLVVMQT
jgi:transcriptional regulator with XRE-family HTH domain